MVAGLASGRGGMTLCALAGFALIKFAPDSNAKAHKYPASFIRCPYLCPKSFYARVMFRPARHPDFFGTEHHAVRCEKVTLPKKNQRNAPGTGGFSPKKMSH